MAVWLKVWIIRFLIDVVSKTIAHKGFLCALILVNVSIYCIFFHLYMLMINLYDDDTGPGTYLMSAERLCARGHLFSPISHCLHLSISQFVPFSHNSTQLLC